MMRNKEEFELNINKLRGQNERVQNINIWTLISWNAQVFAKLIHCVDINKAALSQEHKDHKWR